MAMTMRDQVVLERVRAHHAEMVGDVQRMEAAARRAEGPSAMASALSSLACYWTDQLLPHAVVEERTFYAEAESAGLAWLVAALTLEHEELRARGLELRRIGKEIGAPPADPGSTAVACARAAALAAGASAVFAVPARVENEVLLPALAAAGRALPPLLERMERAFAGARRRRTRAAAAVDALRQARAYGLAA